MVHLGNIINVNCFRHNIILCEPKTGKPYPKDDNYKFRICTDGGIMVIQLPKKKNCNIIVITLCARLFPQKTHFEFCLFNSAEDMCSYFEDEKAYSNLKEECVLSLYELFEKINGLL